MTMRAHMALVLALNMASNIASPAFAETIVGRASVIDATRSTSNVSGLTGATPESGQLCDDGNETNHRCGLGTEWAVTDRVSIKSEALYLRLQKGSFNRTNALSGPGETKRIDHVDSEWVGRIGMNFKLGGTARENH
jgi:opacity protein-like surface antigen